MKNVEVYKNYVSTFQKKKKRKFYDLPIATNQNDKILLFQEKDWKSPIEEDYVRKE